MAGQHGYHPKHARLIALLVLVSLAAGLVRRVALYPSSSPSSSLRSNWPTHPAQANVKLDPRSNRIHGRWEAVRASLGLPPLPHAVIFTPRPDTTLGGRPDKRASRFDLGRKRLAEEAARRRPLLHFAPETHPGATETIAAAL